VIVAHRASTAARADLVVWLEAGAVRTVAPHDRLWREPEYRRLFEPDGDAPARGQSRPMSGAWWSAPAIGATGPAGAWCAWSPT
jgi:ATP-binding cassette, subfamily B, bacterial